MSSLSSLWRNNFYIETENFSKGLSIPINYLLLSSGSKILVLFTANFSRDKSFPLEVYSVSIDNLGVSSLRLNA